jgi:alkylation response protein AidB-like acyl-CoA dehydrogenase
MDLRFSDQYQAFRREVQNFLKENWQPTRDKAAITAFRRKAAAAGYLYRSVPRAYGGGEQPSDVLKAHIIREEFGKARAPRELSNGGVNMVVPTLLECGSEWQREQFIEKTIFGEYIWAQGYSEPGAGSDLASLKTRAELVGDKWVINGQKIWTSMADHAHYMFMLARTEPEAAKHAGISYLLLDLKQPGITIRPIKQATGAAEFCEVFFDNVETPVDWIVGNRGEGWTVSKSTLKHERNSAGSGTGSLTLFNQVVKLAKSVQINGKPATQDPLIRDRLARLEGYAQAHAFSGFYQLTRDSRNESSGLLSQMNKLIATDIGHEVSAIATEVIGTDSLLMPGAAAISFGDRGDVKAGNEKWMNQILSSLAMAMGGGTSNIQRNVIAERGLGLPKD